MNVHFAMLNGWEVVGILAVVLIIFGDKNLPEVGKGLGQGIKEFKKSSREIQDEIQQAIDVDAPRLRRAASLLLNPPLRASIPPPLPPNPSLPKRNRASRRPRFLKLTVGIHGG